MARSLPRRPSLSSLQKQAKKLLRLFRQNDAEAASRVRQHHPRPDAFSALRDAQLVIAREYGSRDWSALRQDVDAALILGEHPNPAIRDHLKSGHRPSSRPGR